MPFAHTLVSLEALHQAQALARLIGGDEFLQAQAKEITSALLARPSLPSHIIRREASTTARYELRRVEVRPSTVRRLNTKARDTMRRTHPAAFAAAVTPLAPEHSHHVRLDAARAGKRSLEWAALKEAGAAQWQADLRQRFGDRDWTQPGVQAQTLFELRQLRRGTESAVSAAKLDLMQFVTGNDLPFVIPGHSDGKLVTRENGLRYAVDYDMLEQRFPDAAQLISRTPTAGSTRLEFSTFVATPDDPDDSDDSAFGMDYRRRNGLA